MNVALHGKEDYFSIEDVVSYSNIEITHVNDNKVPTGIRIKKAIIFLLAVFLLAGLFYI